MYVPENKAAAYFPVSKNHVLTEIMLELLVHIFGHFRSCVNSQEKLIRPVSF